jgi:hypothetical protein
VRYSHIARSRINSVIRALALPGSVRGGNAAAVSPGTGAHGFVPTHPLRNVFSVVSQLALPVASAASASIRRASRPSAARTGVAEMAMVASIVPPAVTEYFPGTSMAPDSVGVVTIAARGSVDQVSPFPPSLSRTMRFCGW